MQTVQLIIGSFIFYVIFKLVFVFLKMHNDKKNARAESGSASCCGAPDSANACGDQGPAVGTDPNAKS